MVELEGCGTEGVRSTDPLGDDASDHCLVAGRSEDVGTAHFDTHLRLVAVVVTALASHKILSFRSGSECDESVLTLLWAVVGRISEARTTEDVLL